MTCRTRRADSGLSLVEAVVTVSLTSVVLLVVGGLFVSTFLAERIVSASSVAASEAQVTARSINERVSSSSGLVLTAPASDDQLLVVRSAGTDASIVWVCTAWYYSSSTGNLYSTQAPAGNVIAAPTPAELNDWTLVLSDVTPRGADGIFGTTGDEVTIQFTVAAGSAPPVEISTTVVRPDVATSSIPGGSQCY